MIVFGKTIYKDPYLTLLPPLAEGDYNTLKADISERGLIVPIVIDEQNNIIDGHNRLRIAAELNLTEIPFDIRVNLSEEEKQQLALDLNLHRRHLDKEQRAGFALQMKQQGMSYPQIAEKLGVDPKTVWNDVNRTLENSKVELPPTTGKDGKTRPATMPKTSVITRNQREANRAVKMLENAPELPGFALTITDLKREVKRQEKQDRIETVQAAELPLDTFHVLAVDPPWSYGRQGDPTHRAANPYPQMTVEEICAFPVATLAHDDCVLWLWTTNAYMREAYQVADAWGFQVKTILTWVKDRMGTGDWLRGQTEHCLMAIKGRPVVNLTNQTTVISGPLREHSRKPDEFFELVNTLCPGKKAELFAREAREGWTVYGNQLHTFNG
jgi:N6-adenosine-specific RNA methylase IME4